MDQRTASTSTAKPITREETKSLLSLIENSNIINNRTTNATTNKLKNEEWQRISDVFNATSSQCRRTPQQLRMKWENLKKNSRKRNTSIRMNNLRTGGGPPDYIPRDDILDRVAALLGSTGNGFSVQFGGDSEPASFGGDAEVSFVDSIGSEAEPASFVDNTVGQGSEPASYETDIMGAKLVLINQGEMVGEANKNVINIQKPKMLATPKAIGFKRKRSDENRGARNQAIADYFLTKRKILEAKLENIIKENEKLKLEIDNLKNNK